MAEAKLGLRTNQTFSQSSQFQNGVNSFIIRDENNLAVYPFDASNYVWSIKLNEHIPLALNLEMSAGEMNLDFSDLNLTSFNAEIAAGMITLTLPNAGIYSGVVDGSASTMKIYIPVDGKLCVQSDTAVTIFTSPSGFDRTANCGRADVPSLEINNAVGIVTLEYVK
jgi:hypothetical protein